MQRSARDDNALCANENFSHRSIGSVDAAVGVARMPSAFDASCDFLACRACVEEDLVRLKAFDEASAGVVGVGQEGYDGALLFSRAASVGAVATVVLLPACVLGDRFGAVAEFARPV